MSDPGPTSDAFVVRRWAARHYLDEHLAVLSLMSEHDPPREMHLQRDVVAQRGAGVEMAITDEVGATVYGGLLGWDASPDEGSLLLSDAAAHELGFTRTVRIVFPAESNSSQQLVACLGWIVEPLGRAIPQAFVETEDPA